MAHPRFHRLLQQIIVSTTQCILAGSKNEVLLTCMCRAGRHRSVAMVTMLEILALNRWLHPLVSAVSVDHVEARRHWRHSCRGCRECNPSAEKQQLIVQYAPMALMRALWLHAGIEVSSA